MININIEQNVLKGKEENVRCVLCGGSHGDNTLCQMPWRAGGMRFSKKTRNFVHELITEHGKFDPDQGCYDLDFDILPDTSLEQLAYLIYLDNPDFASEATGADNARYDRVMMPALLTYLKNTTDRDEAIEFMKTWREGLIFYAERQMKALIEDEVKYYDKAA